MWLPQGSLGGVAGVRMPMPVAVAKAEPKAKPVRVAKATPKPKPTKVAKAAPKPKPAKVAKAAPKPKPAKVAQAAPKPKKAASKKAVASTSAKVHVVKPNETLYRVATRYELSVDELRRLNRMSPDDSNIRPGQRLRVSG